jgi:hypothetical protein
VIDKFHFEFYLRLRKKAGEWRIERTGRIKTGRIRIRKDRNGDKSNGSMYSPHNQTALSEIVIIVVPIAG